MDPAQAVDELYGTPPTDFVAVRTRLAAEAKTADDPALAAELRSLRKPTAVAWLLNRAARTEPTAITDVLDLGERMRTAQAKGDGAALSAARPERQAVIDGLVAAVRRCAEATGSPFGAAAVDGVTSTAVAALADPASGQALASGRLLRPLAYAGLGEVELDDAVALLRLVPPLPDGDEDDAVVVDEAEAARQRKLASAREALRDAERDLGAARLVESEARAALTAARDRRRECTSRVSEQTAEVKRLETRPGAPRAPLPPSSAGS